MSSNGPYQGQTNTKMLRRLVEVFIDAFSGASGSLCAQLLLYPIENYRTRLQAHSNEITQQNVATPNHQPNFSQWHYFKNLLKNEGVLSFYKGLETALIGTVLSSGIYFWWYRFFKNSFYHILKRKELSDCDITIITLFAGVISSLLTIPIWFVNFRMTVSQERKSTLKTIKDIYNSEGLLAFYKGALPNLILVTNPIINFVIYENLKKQLLQKKFSLNPLQLFIINSIAKTAATVFTYPLITLKVVMQKNTSSRKIGMMKFILGIIQDLGLEGLYVGFQTKLIQALLLNGLLMVIFEKLQILIKIMMLQYMKNRKLQLKS